jgi:hypothetical protein
MVKKRKKKEYKRGTCTTTSGLLYFLEVYTYGVDSPIGTGLGYEFDNAQMRPTLINREGEPLSMGMYQLRIKANPTLSVFYIGKYYVN